MIDCADDDTDRNGQKELHRHHRLFALRALAANLTHHSATSVVISSSHSQAGTAFFSTNSKTQKLKNSKIYKVEISYRP